MLPNTAQERLRVRVEALEPGRTAIFISATDLREVLDRLEALEADARQRRLFDEVKPAPAAETRSA